VSKIRRTCRSLSEDLNNNPITIKEQKIINKKTKIFTMGSCFALEISKFLYQEKYNICNIELDKIGKHRPPNLIWYNTYSILYEFEKLIGEFNYEDIWKVSDGRYQDPYRRCIFSKSKDKLLLMLKELDNSIRNCIINSDVLIITLGLVEVWFQPNGKAICAVPGHPNGKGGGQNSKFKFTNYDDNLDNMRKCMSILQTINNKCKVILTTSPVPLYLTFRDLDQLVANTESKSILRSVCGQISREYDNVIYYPAYEMVLNSSKKDVFKKDARHVRSTFVSKIMKHFEKYFME
jgi:hypothetical protein